MTRRTMVLLSMASPGHREADPVRLEDRDAERRSEERAGIGRGRRLELAPASDVVAVRPAVRVLDGSDDGPVLAHVRVQDAPQHAGVRERLEPLIDLGVEESAPRVPLVDEPAEVAARDGPPAVADRGEVAEREEDASD